MATRERTDAYIREIIEAFALRGWRATDIRAELKRNIDAGNKAYVGRKLPDIRTVQRIRKDALARDQSGPWRLAEAEGDEARIVLPVLAELVARTGFKYVTRSEAEWLIRIYPLASDLAPWDGSIAPASMPAKEGDLMFTRLLRLMPFQIARLYVERSDNAEDTLDLDMFLAYAPWRSQERAEEYYQLLMWGQIPEPPEMLHGLVPPRLARDSRERWHHLAPYIYEPPDEEMDKLLAAMQSNEESSDDNAK